MHKLCITLMIVLAMMPAAISAQEQEAEKKNPPRVAMCVPLAVPLGKTTHVTLRGWDLDDVSEIQTSSETVVVKVLAHESAQVPGGQNAMRVGDKQLKLEVTVPESLPVGEVSLTLKSPAGESAPHQLLVGGEHPVVQEKEENDGFQVAQPIEIPQIVDGQLHADRNVDAFSFEVESTQQVVIDLHARRLGSELDGILTLYDAEGNILAVNDDHAKSRDSQLVVSLPSGKYYLSLQDANDRGGPAHPYRLVVTASK